MVLSVPLVVMALRIELRKQDEDEPVGASALRRVMHRIYALGPSEPAGLAPLDRDPAREPGHLDIALGPGTDPVPVVRPWLPPEPSSPPTTPAPAARPRVPNMEPSGAPVPPAARVPPPPPGVELRRPAPSVADEPAASIPANARELPTGKWADALLDIAAFLGEHGGPAPLYVEMAMQLELGAGAGWMRRLLTWGRKLFRRNDEMHDPDKLAEVGQSLAGLEARGVLVRLLNANLRAASLGGSGVARAYDRDRLGRCYEAAVQRLAQTPSVK